MKKVFQKIDKAIVETNKLLIVAMMALMFILLFINVVGRYFFSTIFLGADEIARHLMVTIAFIGIGYGMRESKHSSFTFLQDVVNDKVRKVIRIVVALLIYFLMITIFYYGIQYTVLYMNNSTQILQWKLGYWYMFIPIGAMLFIYHFTVVVKDFINEAKYEDIEREIRSGDELVSDSKYASYLKEDKE